MGLFDSILPEDSNTRNNVLDAVQALGMGLLQGDRDHPFGNNMAQNLAAIQAGNRSGMSRQALKAVLLQRGFSDADAEKLSASEAAAKLAIQGKEEEGFGNLVKGYYGGGPVSNLGSGAVPKVSPDAPAGPAAGASLNGGGLTGDMGAWSGAIKAKESGGKYDIVGPTHPKYGRALGAYQVMESNLPQWSKETLGREVSADEFLANPQIQDAIFAKKFGQSVEKYGNPQDAASVWFTGKPAAQGANQKDSLGTTGANYVASFNANLGKQQPTQVADATGMTPVGPVTRSDLPPVTPNGVSGQNPNRPVQYADNEDQTQALESRMGMYPRNVYGITPGAPKVADGAADMPTPGAQPAEFRIPPGPGGQGGPAYAPDSTTARAVAVRQSAAAAADQEKVKQGLAVIAMSGRYGDRGKGLAESIKLQIQPLLKNMEDTDAQKLIKGAGLDGTPEGRDLLLNSITGNAQTSLQKEYGSYAKQEQAAGRTPLSQIDYDLKVRGASKPEQNTTIKNFANPIAKGLGDQFLTARQEATDAAKAIPAIHQARSLLDEGVFTGPLAEQKLKLAQFGTAIGLKNPKIETTEAFGPVIGQQVLANIKVLGANPSNSDRDFAEKMAGGKITLNEGSLRRIMDINEGAHRTRIQNYNESVAPLVNTADDELKPYAEVLKVREPAPYQKRDRAPAGASAQPQAAAPAGGISDGATATNPKTGERVVRQNGRWVPVPAQSGGVL